MNDRSGPRLDLRAHATAAYRDLVTLGRTVCAQLDPRLHELVKVRASQINGCAFCIDMHAREARAAGESEQRLYVLSAWRDVPFFSEAERAALALTEALTELGEGHVPDAVYRRAAAHFDDETLAALLFAIATINAWNRLSIAARMSPGCHRP
ncbi:MAG: carboxymuconolactone decarboxylase family protein [Solirubrobacteraceae bacterium]